MAAAGAQCLQAGMRRPGTKPEILDHADGVSMLGWCPVGALYDGGSRAPAHTTTHPPPRPRGPQKLQEGSGVEEPGLWVRGRAEPRERGTLARSEGARHPAQEKSSPFSSDSLEGRLTQRELRAGADSQSGVRPGAS